MKVRILAFVCFAAAANFGGVAFGAEEYPIRPLRFVSPFPPGGFNDMLARMIGQKLGDAWGRQVVVDNRPGANMIIGTELVAKAPPDGYTILLVAMPHTINPSLYKLPYDTVKDFAPIVLAASAPNLLVVHPSLRAQSVQELIALAKSPSVRLSFASSGSGSIGHLTTELFKTMTGASMVHIPYKGSSLALTALIAGEVQVYIESIITLIPYARSGKIRALAVVSSRRSSAAPELPTTEESGFSPGFDVTTWYGILAPGRTPQNIVRRLNADIVRVLALSDIKERLARDGVDVVGSTPEEFARRIQLDITKWAKVVNDSGLKVD